MRIGAIAGGSRPAKRIRDGGARDGFRLAPCSCAASIPGETVIVLRDSPRAPYLLHRGGQLLALLMPEHVRQLELVQRELFRVRTVPAEPPALRAPGRSSRSQQIFARLRERRVIDLHVRGQIHRVEVQARR